MKTTKMKSLLAPLTIMLLTACGAQNNITLSPAAGNCADGSVNASYCLGVTILNNSGGQNWITNTNFPISNLVLSVAGPSNVGYPTSSGSSFDPNNCLGSSITPGGSCTFYLWLNGESAAVGTKPSVVVTASYTINNTLFGGSSTTATSNVTVYETPSILMTSSTGSVESYNANGFAAPYTAESGETVVNDTVNDGYYGFLYLAGNNGIYYSGNGTYIGNITQTSSSVRGASNLLLNNQTLYATPIGSLGSSVYSSALQGESYSWQQYATGLTSVAANVSTNNGSQLFFTQSAAPNVYLCTSSSSSGNNCNQEGLAVPLAKTINALGFTNLGNMSGTPLTGLVAGANNGLWIESGTLGNSANSWSQVGLSGGVISNPINQIVNDSSLNLYIVDSSNLFYELPVNQWSGAKQMTAWTLPSGTAVASMVFDNAGNQLFVATTSGVLYTCPVSAGCSLVGFSLLSSIFSLNLVTSLTVN